MCLYAIATDDRVLAVVAGSGIVIAAVLADVEIATRLLGFGLCTGLPLLALGISRVRRGVSRV